MLLISINHRCYVEAVSHVTCLSSDRVGAAAPADREERSRRIPGIPELFSALIASVGLILS